MLNTRITILKGGGDHNEYVINNLKNIYNFLSHLVFCILKLKYVKLNQYYGLFYL